MGRGKLLYIGKGGFWGGYVLQQQVLVNRLGVGAAWEIICLQNGFAFGGENETVIVETVVKRLLSHTVAGQEEFICIVVPDGKGKHAVDMVNALLAVLLVEVQDDFRVAVGFEGVACGD